MKYFGGQVKRETNSVVVSRVRESRRVFGTFVLTARHEQITENEGGRTDDTAAAAADNRSSNGFNNAISAKRVYSVDDGDERTEHAYRRYYYQPGGFRMA